MRRAHKEPNNMRLDGRRAGSRWSVSSPQQARYYDRTTAKINLFALVDAMFGLLKQVETAVSVPGCCSLIAYWNKVQYPSRQILARKIAAPLEIVKMSPFLQQTVDRKGAVI